MKSYMILLLLFIYFGTNAANQNVTSDNFLFSPNSVTINAGEKVSFTNIAGLHFVQWLTAPGTLPANSANLSGTPIEYTLTTVGTYTYRCGIHASMLGTIVVEQAALPIRLQKFDLKLENHKHILKWTTESETNTSHFILEAAYDQLTFNEIGMLKAIGSSYEIKNYRFEYEPISKQTSFIYYRLKSVDFDGSFDYSGIITVKFLGHDIIKTYPNPVSNVLILEGFGHIYHHQEACISVINAEGKLVFNPRKLSENELTSWHDIDVSSLNSGKYFVVISSKTDTHKTIPFIVQR